MRTCCRCGKPIYPVHQERICPGCRAQPFKLGKALSPRERQVSALVAEFKLNKEIAWELKLTEGTVKVYLNKIFHKLGIHNRTELAVWWLRHIGAVPEGEPELQGLS